MPALPALSALQSAAASPVTRWALLVLLVAAAYSVGRFTAPVEVEERVVVRTLETHKLEEKKRTETKRQTFTRTVVTPDAGTVTEVSVTELTRDAVDRHEDTRRETLIDRSSSTSVRSDWVVSLQVGAQFKGDPALQLAGPLVLGADVKRRIAGGVAAGVWGSTSGAAGVSVSVEW